MAGDFILAPDGTTRIATALLDGRHHGLNLLEIGTEDSAAPVNGDNPMPVSDDVLAAAVAALAQTLSGLIGTYATVSTGQVTAATTPATLLPANPARRSATIYYDDAAILYLLDGSGVPGPTNYTVKLGQGYFTSYDVPAGFVGAVKGVWSAATGAAAVTERTA